jgi:hypothetical protein
MAKPPDTRKLPLASAFRQLSGGTRTEELLAATTLLEDLDQAGLQLLDGRNVVRKNTHFSRLRRNIDLNDILRLVD